MSEVAFTAERLKEFERIVSRYEKKASALLPTLYLAQEQFGYLSRAVMDYVAGLLELPRAHVYEAVSFYVLFKKKDMGRYCLQVCNNITCTMMGSEGLLEVIREELNIGPNEVTRDGLFSCMTVQCLGSCDTAPVVQVNDDYVERLNPESLRSLLRGLASGKVSAEEGEVLSP